MKLYAINFTHFSPKDSETGIKEYIIANDDKQVFNYLANKDNDYTYWYVYIDINFYLYDYNDEKEAQEAMNEWIKNTLEEKGNLWDENYFTDPYYGETGYFWEEVELDYDSLEVIDMLDKMVKFGLAKKV